MSTPTDIIAGTITITNGSTAIVGVGTSWSEDDLRSGDSFVFIEGGDGFQLPIIDTITNNLNGTLVEPWAGPTLTGVRYRIRYQWDSSRVSAQTRNMIQKLYNGNVEALAAVTGPGVPVFNGPHTIIIKPETDFINGVAFNVQVDTLPDRDAFDGQSAGFAVLVSNVGDGRSAVYSKNSNSVADWSDPAYVTGSVGPIPLIEAGTITTGAPGTSYIVTIDPITGGYEINFTIPAGPGFYWENAYNAALAYAESSVVRNNGSSFIAIQAVPIGESPSGAFPPVDTAYWEVLASRGANGTGTGDVVGPDGGTVNNGFVLFADVTGKLIKTVNAATYTALLNAMVGDTGTGGTKGLVPAPGAGDAAANKFLKADGTWQVVASNGGLTRDALMALELSEAKSNYVFLGDMIADAYKVLTLVDVAGATNLDTSETGYLKPTLNYTADLTTVGFAISSGNASGDPAHAAGNAFDNSTSTNWLSNTTGSAVANAAWIGQDFGAGNAKAIRRCTLMQTFANGTVTDGWVEYADAVAGPWSVAVTVNGLVVNVLRTVDIPAVAGSHRCWRFRAAVGVVTSNSWWMNEIQMMELNGFTNFTVASEILPSAEEPDEITVVMRVVPTDAITLNTDILVDVGRDGSSWAPVVLEQVSPPVGGVYFLQSQPCDVSGQPSGNTPRYRIRNANNKGFKVDGTVLAFES